jgi:hypothetical protein
LQNYSTKHILKASWRRKLVINKVLVPPLTGLPVWG